MNYVVWWQPCDGQLSIYMCVMDDCRISNVLIYLICLCLSLLVMMNVFLYGHMLLQVSTLKSWPSYFFLLVV